MIRKWIKYYFDLYDIEDLQAGGHCGCCGAPMPNIIFDKRWAWGLCDKCGKTGGEKNGK